MNVTLMRTELHSNERVLRQARAYHHFALKLVFGRLFLTNRRLVFESGWFGSFSEVIDLSQIRGVRACWTSVFMIPVFPGSIALELKGRGTERFCVSKRAEWIAAIGEAVG